MATKSCVLERVCSEEWQESELLFAGLVVTDVKSEVAGATGALSFSGPLEPPERRPNNA